MYAKILIYRDKKCFEYLVLVKVKGSIGIDRFQRPKYQSYQYNWGLNDHLIYQKFFCFLLHFNLCYQPYPCPSNITLTHGHRDRGGTGYKVDSSGKQHIALTHRPFYCILYIPKYTLIDPYITKYT